MTRKENTLEIIRYGNPQRIVPTPPTFDLAYHGCHHESYGGEGMRPAVGTRWQDIWGVGWHKALEGVMGYPCDPPLPSPRSLPGYRWPDPEDARIFGKIHRLMKNYTPGDHFLTGSHRCVLWERAYKVVGMENLMVYFHTEKEFAREVLHRIMDFQIGIAGHYLQAGVDMVGCSDDLGSQRGSLLSPEVIREFFIPEYRRLFDLYRAEGVFINFHSCGNSDALIEPFIDLGVDILNPIQATANDLPGLRDRACGRIALMGGVSSAVIMNGPAEHIRRETIGRMWQLGRNGGYFCRWDQSLPFPEENIAAFRDAVEEYGVYPLRDPAELGIGTEWASRDA